MTAIVHIRKGREKSLQRRHPWVFSGSIHRVEGDPIEGDLVSLVCCRWLHIVIMPPIHHGESADGGSDH
ncbi:MAG: hypothetical protein R2813_13750 [Flavobacteriales bacterium]